MTSLFDMIQMSYDLKAVFIQIKHLSTCVQETLLYLMQINPLKSMQFYYYVLFLTWILLEIRP